MRDGTYKPLLDDFNLKGARIPQKYGPDGSQSTLCLSTIFHRANLCKKGGIQKKEFTEAYGSNISK